MRTNKDNMNITHNKAFDQALDPFTLKECDAGPGADKPGCPNYLERNSAGRLREWQKTA